MSETKESPYYTALRSRERWHKTVDVSEVHGLEAGSLPKIAFRVNSKKDDLDAIRSAHVLAERYAKGHTEISAKALQDDADFLVSAKNCEALWRACRDADDPECPAFPAPEAMLELDTDALEALLNIYNECRTLRGPLPAAPTPQWIEAVRDACVAMPEGGADPVVPLAAFSREYLSTFVLAAMRLWHDERRQMLAIIADHEGKRKKQPSRRKARNKSSR